MGIYLKLFKITIIGAFTVIMTTGCGGSSSFTAENSANALNNASGAQQLHQDDITDLIHEERIVLENEEDIPSLNGSAGRAGNEVSGQNGNAIDNLAGILPGLPIPGGNVEDGSSSCGDRSSHTIKIKGPDGSYVGVGPGNVEVSSKKSHVCVSPDEVLVGVGDLDQALMDGASCGKSGDEQKIFVCQVSADKSTAQEVCITKEQLRVQCRYQGDGEKTYLGQCKQSE